MQMFFFAVEDDMRQLMKLADTQGMHVYPAKYKVSDTPKRETPITYKMTEETFLLLPREFTIDDIIYIEGTKGKAGTAFVEMAESPVIRVTPSVMWGTKLDVGSIEITDEPPEHKFSLTERKWLFFVNMLKRWHKTEKNQGWVGPAAAKLLKEQRIQLGLGKKQIELW